MQLTIEPTQTGRFAVAVRIPSWAQGRPVPSDLYRYIDSNISPIEFKLNGQVIQPDIKNGFAFIERQWQKRDVIEMVMSMPARYVVANPNVAADAGKIAIEKGPVVYCAEWLDNDSSVFNMSLVDTVPLWSDTNDLLGGIVIVHAKVISPDGSRHDLTMIPYYAWANRQPSGSTQGGQGPMAVWLAKQPE